ncbi:MAG: hypothetical protein ABI990_03880 [Actinomycetota bacterium]
MKRRFLALIGFATGIFAGSVVYRRSFARRPEHVDVYFGDGSMVSFVDGSSEADALLPVAHAALSAVRS